MHLLHVILLTESLGQPEVDKLDLCLFAFIVHEEILRLQIAMHNVVLMQMLHCRQHLPHNICSMLFCEALGPHYSVKKLSARAVLHDDVHISVVNEGLVEFDDIGVVNLLQNE